MVTTRSRGKDSGGGGGLSGGATASTVAPPDAVDQDTTVKRSTKRQGGSRVEQVQEAQDEVVVAALPGRPPAAPAAGGGSSSSGSEDEACASDWSDSDEEGGQGVDMVAQLAASIRAALRVKVGAKAAKQPAGKSRATHPSQQDERALRRLEPPPGEGVAAADKDESEAERGQQLVGTSGRAANGNEGEDEDHVDDVEWRPTYVVPEVRSSRPKHQTGPPQPDREPGLLKQLVVPKRDPKSMLEAARKSKPDTAGAAYFDLPATQITEEVKLELRLLRLRGALDPKRFYKSSDKGRFPKYFSVGTVLDGAADFYSSRLAKRERKTSLAKEIMADQSLTTLRKKRYNQLQEAATRHQKVKKRKTNLPRDKRVKKRVKL